MLRTKPRQRQWRNVARDNNQVNDIGKISDQGVPKIAHSLLNPVSQIAKENRWVGVRAIQLIPNERLFLFTKEVGNQGRLSGSRISGDQRHWQSQVRVQP